MYEKLLKKVFIDKTGGSDGQTTWSGTLSKNTKRITMTTILCKEVK